MKMARARGRSTKRGRTELEPAALAFSGIPAGGTLRVVIMGSGRVGSRVAASLATDGHSVAVIDPDRQQVMRLPRALVESGAIELVPGDGSSGSSMRTAGIETADLFLALSGDDAMNGLAAQKARTMFGVRRVGCRVQDDGLHELYTGLGIMVTSPTHLVTDVILQSMSDM